MIETIVKTILRKAEVSDKEQIVDLVKQFFEESLGNYGLRLSLETINETIANIVTTQVGFVADKEGKLVGCAGAQLAPSMFDKTQLIGQEFMWYVTKEERKTSVGLRLLKKLEEECISRGASLVIMGCMGNLYVDVLDRFYKRNGFKTLEKQYIKTVL